MARLTIRIDFESASGFGPGKARLLERIAETGSIRQAAISMEMSYRQAWLLVQAMQETFGGTVVTTTTGGQSGGGATLTDLGKSLLARYRHMEASASRAVAADLRALSTLAGAAGKD